MRAISRENKISCIAVWIGIEGDNEYFIFYSTKQSAKTDHIFCFEIDDELKMTEFENPKMMYSSLGIEVDV